MDFEWVAVGLSDVTWIALAFGLGLLARGAGLPPLVGYLAAGFLLGAQGFANGMLIQKLADLGITLLLFTVGLKLNLSNILRPQVWAVSALHMVATIAFFTLGFYALALIGVAQFANLDLRTAVLIAFALSFSSTVFAVKALEERGQMNSLQGQIAIGILIVQDLAAVAFIAVSAGEVPSIYAFTLLLLIPLRPVLHLLLQRVGHGELMVLYGFLLALGGAEIFELVKMKGDLGALVLGIMIANQPKAEEMSKLMLGFKDLFLIGFFLSIGMAGGLTISVTMLALFITPLALIKGALFFWLLTRFRLRARTSLLTSLNLTSFSEFGLIVAAFGVANNWLDTNALVTLSLILSLSFALAAALSKTANWLYADYRPFWQRWQSPLRIADDRLVDIGQTRVAIVGMGRIGTGAYESLLPVYGDKLVGIDSNSVKVKKHLAEGRRVILGDASDADFWDRVDQSHQLDLVMLTLPNSRTSISVLRRLDEIAFNGQIAATARYPDETALLQEAGATTVYNIYTEAGSGFAAHVNASLLKPGTEAG